MYYLSRENKGADQLCSSCTADLRLCFRSVKNLFSHDEALAVQLIQESGTFLSGFYACAYEKSQNMNIIIMFANWFFTAIFYFCLSKHGCLMKMFQVTS